LRMVRKRRASWERSVMSAISDLSGVSMAAP
jgi:hypothetical protein